MGLHGTGQHAIAPSRLLAGTTPTGSAAVAWLDHTIAAHPCLSALVALLPHRDPRRPP